ncbi:MAG: hypothetical protein ACFFFB_00635 [Candidatus Heimdallarchaeota archaeon]
MMFSNIEDYERRINELNYQISELQNRVNQLQLLIKEKDEQLNRLYNENLQLKSQIGNIQRPTQSPYFSQQNIQSSSSPQYQNFEAPQNQQYEQSKTQSPYFNQQATQEPVIRQTENPIVTTSANTSSHKRECPNCGAYGFAIKEVDDKSRLLSYVPRRIYAKKRVCTKCFYEF